MSSSDRAVSAKAARVHYEAFELVNGVPSWHQLPAEIRQRLVAEADEWRASMESAGFSIIPTEALRHVQSAMKNLDRARLT